MDYIKSSLNWEEFFIQEALDLEEKMNSFDHRSLGHSRLRISIDTGILEWKKYHTWIFSQTGIKSIAANIEEDQLNRIRDEAVSNFSTYSYYPFWNQDLIPITMWEDCLIVFGLSYDPQLVEIPKTIFILAHPDVLSYVGRTFFPMAEQAWVIGPTLFQNADPLKGIILDAKPVGVDFSASVERAKKSDPMWDYISERHEEYCFEVKKQFNAYVVLRIINQKTQLYKLDSELETQIEDSTIFNFELESENPFQKVFQTGISESFNITQIGIKILNYKYICITALKRGTTVVGFLLGLKESALAEDDQVLLEDLAKESA